MWPFSILHGRRHRKRRDIALFIYLGAHVFSTLGPEGRARVEAEVTEILHRIRWCKAAHARYATPELRAFGRALAMQRLGMPTAIEGVTWDSLLPRGRGLIRQDYRFGDFRPLAPATAEALAFLRARGIDVTGVLHDPYAETHPPPPRLL